MKTKYLNYSCFSVNLIPGGCQSKLGITSLIILLASGCATQKPGGVLQIGELPAGRPVVLEPGAVAVTCPGAPGAFSFDKARGRTMYGSEGAANAARSVLEPPNTNDPGLAWALGPIGFAAAPFAAAYGALNAHHATMSIDKLSESESDLAQAMATMARQQSLRDFVVEAARERTRRQVVSMEPSGSSSPNRAPVSMVLETKLEELKLERTGSSDTSFALQIKARARLLRVSDGAVLYDRPLQYQSGTALFLDWTCPKTFQGVAETACRELADQVAEQVFSTTTDEPVWLGAGHKRAPARVAPMLVKNNAPLQPRPPARFAAFAPASSGQVGIYSTGTVTHVTLQKPLTLWR